MIIYTILSTAFIDSIVSIAGKFNYHHLPTGIYILKGRMSVNGNCGSDDIINVLYLSLFSFS